MCDQPDTLDDLIANCTTYPADMAAEIARLRAQRDQLLAALKQMCDNWQDYEVRVKTRAVIAAVEEAKR